MIDEMAMLTAYGDRGDVREAIRLLAEILTQGRACLVAVMGYVQEPTKDIVDVRELFTTRICLGVTAASHVDMVLGDGARERGALADEIPGDEAHAGIGFVIDAGSRLPVRFRAAYVSDDEIDELVTRCAAWARPGDVIDLAKRRDDHDPDDDDEDGDGRHRDAGGGAGVMRTRRLDPTATPEYRAVMGATVLICALAVLGSVVPAVDHLVTLAMLGLGALAVAGWSCCGCWCGSSGNASRTPPTPAPPPPGVPPTTTPPRRRADSGGGVVMWAVTGWAVVTWLKITHRPRGRRRCRLAVVLARLVRRLRRRRRAG